MDRHLQKLVIAKVAREGTAFAACVRGVLARERELIVTLRQQRQEAINRDALLDLMIEGDLPL